MISIPRLAASPGRLVVLVLAILAAVGVGAQRVVGQMMPLVPDPITTPDLRPIVETLGLSNEQVPALLQLHDGYKQRYETFQDSDVRELQDELVEIGLRFARGRIEIPARRELEAILDRFKRLLTKSQGLDRSFFTEIGTLLSPEQMPLLDRARINRELEVYREILGGVSEMNRGAGVNLAQIARGVDLTPQEREQIEPIIAEYESNLLAKSRSVYNVLADAATVILDLIDDLNIRGMGLEQLAALAQDQALVDRLRNTFDDASRPVQSAAFDVSQLNWRAYRRMHVALGEPNARELRDRYYRRAYREVYQGPASWEARYRAALVLEGLSEERAGEIGAQRDAFLAQDDAAVDSAVTALEASREYKTLRQFTQEEPDPGQAKTDDALARRKSIGENALSVLHALLGEELVAQLDETEKAQQAAQHGDATDGRIRVTADASGSGEVTLSAEPTVQVATTAVQAEGNRFLPQPMSASWFSHLTAELALGDDDQSVASGIYDAYRVEFEALRTAEVPVKKEGEQATVTEESKALEQRQNELTALDARLFADLALLLAEDSATRTLSTYRAARRRAATADVSKSMAQFFGENEPYIDLVPLIAESDLAAEHKKRALAFLESYDQHVSSAIDERLDRAREVHRRSQSMQRAGRRGNRGANQAMEIATEKWREARSALRASNERIVAINRETLDQIISNLPADAAWQLRFAYNQIAYPEIFRDERGADKVLQGALALADLADHQRDRINEVAAQYRSDFVSLCEQMVGLRQQRDFDFFGGQVPRKEDIDREIELEKMRFARNELSARAKLQLTLILSDEQAKVLPELQSR